MHGDSVINDTSDTNDKRSERPAAERARTLPCSRAQAGFWYEEQLAPGTSTLNVFARWRLEGSVSTTHLGDAWKAVIARHPSLRTRFANDDGAPVQIIEPAVAFHVREIDLSLLAPQARDAEAERIASIEAQTPFDITVAPLIRATHVRIGEQLSILMVTAHHMVADGWSFGILARELGAATACVSARQPIVFPTPSRSYGEFVERELARDTDFTDEKRALGAALDGYRAFEVAPDRPRPVTPSPNGAIESVLLDRSLTAGLASLARTNACTLFMLAYAALLVMLNRRTSESDITMGTQVTGRDDVDFEETVGTFINTIPLRTQVDANETFLALLERVRDTVSDALELRHVPMGTIIEILRPKRDISRSALFAVNFIFQRSFIDNAAYGSFKLVDLPSRSAGAMYDLNFFLVERPEGWRFSCEYRTDLFERETIAHFVRSYESLLEEIVADAGVRVRDFVAPDMTTQEKTVDPVPALREEIIAIVASLLENNAFGPNDDIFALGFHSLHAMRFISRIKERHGVDVPLRLLFEHPTIGELTERIALLAERAPARAAVTPIAELNRDGTKPPLFYFHNDITADGLYCRRLAALVGPDQPLFAIAPHGTQGLPAVTSIQEMAADALERILKIAPQGPYRLGGYCAGGLVAYEVARLLAARGERTERLVLVNSAALPQRSLPWLDRLVRTIGANAQMDRKLRARLCFNLAWLNALAVSNPITAAGRIIGRFTKLGERTEPVWQMAEFPAQRREEFERAVAANNAASFTYHLKPYDGDVTLVWSRKQDGHGTAVASEWRAVARNARLLFMNGNRSGPLNENIAEFATVLTDALHG